MTEQPIKIAAKMYECHDAARLILDDKFKSRMQELGLVIKAVADRDKCNEIVAGATVIKDGELHGMMSLLIMAAVVEMVEPS